METFTRSAEWTRGRDAGTQNLQSDTSTRHNHHFLL